MAKEDGAKQKGNLEQPSHTDSARESGNPETSGLEIPFGGIERALNVARGGVFAWAPETREMQANEACYRLHGFEPGQPLKFKNMFGRLVGMDAKTFIAAIEDARDWQEPFDIEYQIEWPDGSKHWIQSRGIWEYDDAGRALYTHGICFDINRRKRMEARLAESEARFRAAEAASMVGSWELDVESMQMKVSDGFAQIHGLQKLIYPAQEHVELLHPDDRDAVTQQIEGAFEGEPYDIEHRIVRQSTGEVRWVLSRGRSVTVRGLCVHGTTRDITERKLAELALRDSAQRFQTLTEASPALVLQSNRHGEITFVNDERWRELTGLSSGSWRDDKWVDAIHPDDRVRVAEQWQEAFGERKTFNAEVRWSHQDGSVRWLLLNALPFYGESGFMGFVGTGTDITHVKRSEQERSQLQLALAEAQKMEAVGTLASGVAHDFNNLLAAIQGYVELAKMQSPDGSRLRHYLSQAEEAVKQAGVVTGGLLTFARGDSDEYHPVRLDQLVVDSMDMLRQLVPASIEFIIDVDDEEIWVDGDSTQLRQVLTNLIVNSRDAMPDGGMLRVSLTTVRDAGNEFAEVAIVDTGVGMSADAVARAFDPFFTTKPQGQGTGLGLAVVHGIINAHRGTVEIQSRLEEGATLIVRVPRCAAISAVEVTPLIEVTGGGERILLVEDNALVREAIALRFEENGYRVIPCGSGEEAAKVVAATREPFGLAVIDVDLPGNDGVKVLASLRQLQRDLPGIFVTGNVNNKALLKAVDGDLVVAKPVDYPQLFQAVHQRLAYENRKGRKAS